nr:MAG TPA: hypothetical protein [Caudoviricetes sp.]
MKIQLLLDVINDMRSVADDLDALAKAMADGGNHPKESKPTPKAKKEAPAVTHEMLRALAVELSRSGKREAVRNLLGQYGAEKITAVADTDLESFYTDLLSEKEPISDATD